MDVCGCEDAVIVFLNPLGPEPAEHPTQSSHTTRQNRAEKAAVMCAKLQLSTGPLAMCFSELPAKLTMLIHLALLLLCFGVGDVHSVHENSEDLHSLLDFKQGITSDPNGALNTWNNRTHYCRWQRVMCTQTRPWRVLGLNLTGQNLEGQISSSLGNLTFLQLLDLSQNNFVGPLPILSHTQQLQILYLNNNNLNGGIPDSLANCSNLLYLDLSVNLLVGQIPPKLGFLPNLLYINFGTNQLEGRIPDELGKLLKLKSLLLGNNRLSGDFPHAILNLSASLHYLGFESNMLGNTLPPNIGDLLPNLVGITLWGNMFKGHIPSSLGNALGLFTIDLGHNNFSGKIPTSFGKLRNLSRLALGGNELKATDGESWEFLHALRNCTSLSYLALFQNQLEGFLPNSVGDLSTNLVHLSLDANNIFGQVPQGIGKLRGLIGLGLGKNKLSGTIEGWLGNLQNLQFLDLGSNNFTGPIPLSIGNLNQLGTLYLDQNEFEGLIPASVGNIPLLDLNLSSNNLNGYIPPNLGNLQDLTILDLSNNNLQGNIPHISNLIQLTTLDLSSNKLSGEIPDSLGQFYGLLSMRMDQNFLTGNIPLSFGDLSMLSMLNLSRNNLSGPIPQALNELGSLTKLDLSFNHLQGDIPRNGVFENATAVSLEGNWGLCGGAMDLRMPLCPIDSRKSETEYYLVRSLIPIFGFASLVMLIYIIIFGKKTSQRTYLFLLSFGKKFPIVSYKDLDQATTGFSESTLIGRGSYGSVYVGKLTQAKIKVAIKVFNLDMKCGDKSFVTECEVLRSIRHWNLLPILTACSTIDNNGDDFKALIYEYMPHGNLDTWLHNKLYGGSSKCLSLVQRVSIAAGIADALAYLHHDCERLIVHCDLKPTNILLDSDMNAYLGDFGIASLLRHSGSNTSTGLKGTIGYIAPEYAQSGQASSRGDVYSFGIVLIEMLIGKRPTDPMFENDLNMVNFVQRNYPDEILHIIDAHLHVEFKGYIQANIRMEDAAYRCLASLMQIALSCTRPIPRERLNMREVATKLHAIRASYAGATRTEQVMLH